MLDHAASLRLTGRKNLLAFSGGVDSTALFYLLHDAKIDFDIAHVNYHTRAESDAEADNARRLAIRYEQQCFIHDAKLSEKNFEHEARKERYRFFERLIADEQYENLITGHQLDDRFEWLLMQLSKGAGLVELIGMHTIETYEDHSLVRPLLGVTKAELTSYLIDNGREWSEDKSNLDERYKRNYFRHHHTAPLLERYHHGVKRSLELLEEDIEELIERPEVRHIDALYYFVTPGQRRSTLTTVDKTLKKMGHLMRQGDRQGLKHDDVVIVGRRYVVNIRHDYTFITPFVNTPMDKPFKERCRQAGIEPLLRPYLATAPAAFKMMLALIDKRAGE